MQPRARAMDAKPDSRPRARTRKEVRRAQPKVRSAAPISSLHISGGSAVLLGTTLAFAQLIST